MQTTTVLFPKAQTLSCADCPNTFEYPITRSNNYPKMCPECRRRRTTANKRRFDERRSIPSNTPQEKDVYTILRDIPDYVMLPIKLIDAAIRDCGGS